MVQIVSGLITYMLLAIYCQREFCEKVSISRVRQLRTKIENELSGKPMEAADFGFFVKEQQLQFVNAKT